MPPIEDWITRICMTEVHYRTQKVGEVDIFAAEGRRDAARAGRARVSEQMRQARDRIAAEVRDARSAAEAARERVAAARREVELAREIEAIERARFEAGDGTLLLVNLREQATLEAAGREVDALADHFKALAAYEAAVGR
jgi:outer membrane protein TolC